MAYFIILFSKSFMAKPSAQLNHTYKNVAVLS